MNCNLNSIKGVIRDIIYGTIIRVSQEDARSL